MDAPALCRDCPALVEAPENRCPRCGSPRLIRHAELTRLGIAHIDCDAFYAAVEKRDNPALADRPVIIGGGTRGVVSTACYIARIHGVKSAMPMFKALALCPQAVVLRPDMRKYAEVSRQIRAIFLSATPLVEPLSLDEAFLDLRGSERLHAAPPALVLARLLRRIETEVGVTASAGLAPNKFLAKLASDFDKPRGFSVIGAAEAQAILAPRPVHVLWGVGPALAARLMADGYDRVGDLARADPTDLIRRYGSMGRRLAELARGQDHRRVDPDSPVKSISAETTFDTDLTDADALRGHLWHLVEKVSARAKAQGKTGHVVVLKLRRTDFSLLTRRVSLRNATNLASVIWQQAEKLLQAELGGGRFYRLIGVGIAGLIAAERAEMDLLDADTRHAAQVESTIDALRARFGRNAVQKGRGWENNPLRTIGKDKKV